MLVIIRTNSPNTYPRVGQPTYLCQPLTIVHPCTMVNSILYTASLLVRKFQFRHGFAESFRDMMGKLKSL